jgi:diguanylate cyclase (GGDEF)-like protein/PAS domain S-box-containing protein
MDSIAHPSLSDCIDLLLDAVCVVDKDGRYVHVSAGFERIFGYAPAEVIGTRMIDLVHPEDRELTLKTARGIMSGDPQFHFENRYVRKDGQVVHIMWSARWSEQHQLRIAVARDVTRRKRAEAVQAALYAISEASHAAEDLPTLSRRIHRIIERLLPAPNFSIAFYDEQSGDVSFPYHVDDRSPASGPRQLDSQTLCEKVIRSGQALLIPAVDAKDSRSSLGIPLQSRQRTIGALVVQGNADDACYTQDDQELLQFVSNQIAAAIERKQMVANLQHAALYDGLTQLPNRALFHDRVQLALTRVRREHIRLSLLYLDLDRFKEVNDTFGHGTGDLLLQEAARRIEKCVRAGDTVARFGGDEFVVLLENTGSPDQTASIAEKIRSALNKPFNLSGHDITVLASIGIAHCPLDGDDEKQLIAHADEAMYLEKRARG